MASQHILNKDLSLLFCYLSLRLLVDTVNNSRQNNSKSLFILSFLFIFYLFFSREPFYVNISKRNKGEQRQTQKPQRNHEQKWLIIELLLKYFFFSQLLETEFLFDN